MSQQYKFSDTNQNLSKAICNVQNRSLEEDTLLAGVMHLFAINMVTP